MIKVHVACPQCRNLFEMEFLFWDDVQGRVCCSWCGRSIALEGKAIARVLL